MKKICVITTGYPTPSEPTEYTFLDQLVCTWSDLGYEVSVICPVPHFVNKKRFYKNEWIRRTSHNNEIRVFHPRFFSFSDKIIFGLRTSELAYYSSKEVINNIIKKIQPDIIYSHFLPSGCLAGSIGHKMGIPSFCAFGESSLWSIKPYKLENVKKRLSLLNGIVSVSTENKKVLTLNNLFRECDIGVFPNGVDHSSFYPRDKMQLRKEFNISENSIVGVYTGAFTTAKGSLRVQKAAEKIPDLKMIYLGSGLDEPKGDNIIFEGKIAHNQIALWLCLADFFILPTLQEGCCNAIIEAMACGLPIISSDKPFNNDIIDKGMAILVNPMNEDEIYQAMIKMVNDKKFRETCSRMSLEKSIDLDIVKRANNIIKFMEDKCAKEGV